MAHAWSSMFGLFRHAGLYDRHASRFAARLYARVASDVAAAGLADGARVLDAGTGPGRVPALIADECPGLRVDGVDLLPEMIDRARATAGSDRVTFTVGDVADLPYPDSAFDIVVSTLSQHHWADPKAGLRELRRVLRPGGRVWIYDMRLSLRRAEAAARAAFPGHVVKRERLRIGALGLLLGRVSVTPA